MYNLSYRTSHKSLLSAYIVSISKPIVFYCWLHCSFLVYASWTKETMPNHWSTCRHLSMYLIHTKMMSGCTIFWTIGLCYRSFIFLENADYYKLVRLDREPISTFDAFEDNDDRCSTLHSKIPIVLNPNECTNHSALNHCPSLNPRRKCISFLSMVEVGDFGRENKKKNPFENAKLYKIILLQWSKSETIFLVKVDIFL